MEECGAAERQFICAHTLPAQAPLVPELTLHLASEITPIWQATELWLAARCLPPPYWAFAWPGSQALARHVLDHPSLVRGRRVLDFAAGCGLAAIACARAGAARVEAAEIDPMAIAAIRLNAARNGERVVTLTGDLVGSSGYWDLILCGDICYEAPMTRHVLPWLYQLASEAEVWIADPGRAYLPQQRLSLQASLVVPTSLELESRTETPVSLYRVLPGPTSSSQAGLNGTS